MMVITIVAIITTKTLPAHDELGKAGQVLSLQSRLSCASLQDQEETRQANGQTKEKEEVCTFQH